MTIYNTPELAQIWLRNGGSRGGMVNAVSVAHAESGGFDRAVSPSADYGLWQINQIDFGTFGLNLSNVFDPDLNCRVAISLSSNGTNWAPWCTCWVNPGRDCGHGFLPNPQPGSPAAYWVPQVATTLKMDPPSVTNPNPTLNGRDSFTSTWSTVTDFFGAYARRSYATLDSIHKGIGRL